MRAVAVVLAITGPQREAAAAVYAAEIGIDTGRKLNQVVMRLGDPTLGGAGLIGLQFGGLASLFGGDFISTRLLRLGPRRHAYEHTYSETNRKTCGPGPQGTPRFSRVNSAQ